MTWVLKIKTTEVIKQNYKYFYGVCMCAAGCICLNLPDNFIQTLVAVAVLVVQWI